MNTSQYYSQNGEDALLWEFFEHQPRGFFIELGAFDGIYLSNTYFFEQQGWTGLCIEAHPQYYAMCQENRSQSICVYGACVEEEPQENVIFYVDKLGLLSTLNASANWTKDVAGRYEARGMRFDGFEPVRVPARTLSGLLDEHAPNQPLDFLSLDVEGAELQVLAGLDLTRHRPRVLVIECRPREALHVQSVLYPYGYFFARRIRQNMIFVQNLADARRLRSIAFSCPIAAQMHPLGEQYTAPPLRVPHDVTYESEKRSWRYTLRELLWMVGFRRFSVRLK